MNYPNLTNINLLAVDIETKDVDLKTLGPGAHRAKYGLSDDRILCVSVATNDREWCFDWNDNTRRWFRDHVVGRDWITANGLYDAIWLSLDLDVFPLFGIMYDILVTESLIDAARNPGQWFSLDYCAQKYLGIKKANDEIEEFSRSQGWKGDARKHLWKIYEQKPEMVRKYAKADARQTYDVYHKQLPVIKQMQLEQVFQLESDLNTVLLRMRRNGVRVYTEQLPKTIDMVTQHSEELQDKIDYIAGFECNVNSNKQMYKAFETLGLPVQYTAKKNPSFTADILEGIGDDFCTSVVELKKMQKLNSTFLTGLDRFIVNDRIYAQFISVKNGKDYRGKEQGTETGRFSCILPNLQQIPKKGKGKELVRRLFIPEYGMLWGKDDQAQEEYRLFGHFARGQGAHALREMYRNDPDADMHQFAVDFVGLKGERARDDGKTLNFLSMYGGGVHKFALKAGLPVPEPWPKEFQFDTKKDFFAALSETKERIRQTEAGKIYYAYHDKLPCIKTTEKAAKLAVENRGYAKTILGRRRYLDKRDARKGLNTTIQGSAGDVGKQWVVDCEKAGVWDILKLHILVHDEQDYSIPETKEAREAVAEAKRIGETCIPFNVPLKVDHEVGPNWADVKEIEG